jgi:hypothetical protein
VKKTVFGNIFEKLWENDSQNSIFSSAFILPDGRDTSVCPGIAQAREWRRVALSGGKDLPRISNG